MKMAKASRNDIEAAIDLSGVLSNVQDGYYPVTDDEDSPTFFDEDDRDHLRFFYDRVMALMEQSPGGLFRVVGGLCTILDNNVLDSDSDVIELHPRLAATSDLIEALRLLCEVYDAMGAPRGPARIKADAAISKALGDVSALRFANISCSQCGAEFGPGDHGFSHCEHHAKATGA